MVRTFEPADYRGGGAGHPAGQLDGLPRLGGDVWQLLLKHRRAWDTQTHAKEPNRVEETQNDLVLYLQEDPLRAKMDMMR